MNPGVKVIDRWVMDIEWDGKSHGIDENSKSRAGFPNDWKVVKITFEMSSKSYNMIRIHLVSNEKGKQDGRACLTTPCIALLASINPDELLLLRHKHGTTALAVEN